MLENNKCIYKIICLMLVKFINIFFYPIRKIIVIYFLCSNFNLFARLSYKLNDKVKGGKKKYFAYFDLQTKKPKP